MHEKKLIKFNIILDINLLKRTVFDLGDFQVKTTSGVCIPIYIPVEYQLQILHCALV